MLEHLRHVLIGLALLVAVYNAIRVVAGLAAVHGRSRRERAQTLTHPPISRWLAVSAVSAGVAWILAGSVAWTAPAGTWPAAFGTLFGWLADTEVPLMLIGCIVYFLIILITNTGLIGIPRYRLLQSRARVLRSAIETHVGETPGRAELLNMIDEAERTAATKIGPLVFSAPLTRLYRANRTMNAAEIQLLCLLSGEALVLKARQIAIRLAGIKVDPKLLSSLRAKINASKPGADAALRADCVSALATIHEAVDLPAESEAERIRVALWLTLVGLAAVLAVSSVLGREPILLAGALGGLLGSLALLIHRQSRSLELIIVSPVAGALNAVGGLLLIGFLASENVNLLGDILRNVWTTPDSVEALALALLLGFSGGLFARLAIAGSNYLLATPGRADSRTGDEDASTKEPTDASAAKTNGHKPNRFETGLPTT